MHEIKLWIMRKCSRTGNHLVLLRHVEKGKNWTEVGSTHEAGKDTDGDTVPGTKFLSRRHKEETGNTLRKHGPNSKLEDLRWFVVNASLYSFQILRDTHVWCMWAEVTPHASRPWCAKNRD